MAFRNANIMAHMIKFNSAASSDFLQLYQDLINKEIVEDELNVKQKTFAPSQMRCDRISWFRLRGTQPDRITQPDPTLAFTAQIGTACHEAIQKRLSEHSLSQSSNFKWIKVSDWLNAHSEFFSNYEMDLEERGYESLLEMTRPYPVRFACDGIIELNGKVYLLEIKTAEASSLNDLTEPKPKHIDQVKCYSTLLHISDVIFLYQERQWGQMKCFEVNFTEFDHEDVRRKMDKVLDLVEANIAPDGLSKDDPDCSQNMCPYYKTCRQWGR